MVTLPFPDVAFPDFGRHGDDAGVLTIVDPRSGELVGTVRSSSRGELRQVIDAARLAQGLWAQTPAEARGRLLREAAELLALHVEELASLTSRETGRGEADARASVLAGVDALRRFAELGPVHRGRSFAGVSTASDYTRLEPRGVVVVLTPWDDQVAAACRLIGAAVVMGNAVVHKPSARCPHLGLRLGTLLSEVLPPDVVQTVLGGASTDAQLAGDPLVDVVAHVGSAAAGHAIARIAAASGAHVVRENGGNDTLIVDAGLDPAWCAREAARGAFADGSRLCTSPPRVYVHREMAERFLAELGAIGAKLNDEGALAPLVDERMRAQLEKQVADATKHGARTVLGGSADGGAGCYYPATVLADCTAEMAIMRDEVYGPVAPVQTVDDFDEALIAAGHAHDGHSATVLTSRIAHAELAIAELAVGTVRINNVFGGSPGAAGRPRRDSGIGYGDGPELLDEFSTAKVVHLAAPGGRGFS
jgi:acyl-CoA reductase-like NAD-dependent aldehyde dehydrogenase